MGGTLIVRQDDGRRTVPLLCARRKWHPGIFCVHGVLRQPEPLRRKRAGVVRLFGLLFAEEFIRRDRSPRFTADVNWNPTSSSESLVLGFHRNLYFSVLWSESTLQSQMS